MTLPATYAAARTRFRTAVEDAGAIAVSHPLAATGPDGEELSIESALLGEPRPERGLVVLSGVHGVEGFIGSALQSDAVARWRATDLPAGVGVLLVHAVNPWGMAWGRRQNEHNVDLNRNWHRSEIAPERNVDYDVVHPLACPDTPEVPQVDELLPAAAALIERHGLPWLRDAITRGQYHHPDGLHYGGTSTEESNVVLEAALAPFLAATASALIVDLHTGHGPWGEVTFLSDQPPGSSQDRCFREQVRADRVEATVDNPEATTGYKLGQIANGARLLAGGTCYSTSLEFGTADDLAQLTATLQEQWVHRLGDRARPDHAAIAQAFRACFTPDDPEWERVATERGRAHLDRCLAAVADGL